MTLQSFLNKEYSDCHNHHIKNPCCICILSAFIIIIIGLAVSATFCFQNYKCPNELIDTIIVVGISLGLSLIVFVIIPCAIGCLINAIYPPEPPPLPIPRHARMSFQQYYTRKN
jgi:hypothetical protein